MMIKKFFLTSLILFSSTIMADGTQVKFVDGWIKQLPPMVPMRAGYMKIENPTKQPVEIIAVQSDAFERVEMHETLMEDGVMKMVEQDTIELPAKSQVELKPGGKHLMLITPKQTMQLGDDIELTITFSDDTSQRIQLEVRQ